MDFGGATPPQSGGDLPTNWGGGGFSRFSEVQPFPIAFLLQELVGGHQWPSPGTEHCTSGHFLCKYFAQISEVHQMLLVPCLMSTKELRRIDTKNCQLLTGPQKFNKLGHKIGANRGNQPRFGAGGRGGGGGVEDERGGGGRGQGGERREGGRRGREQGEETQSRGREGKMRAKGWGEGGGESREDRRSWGRGR